VEFADASPFPAAESLYDNVYVLDREVRGWYSVETASDRARDAPVDAGDGAQAAIGEIPQQLTDALAAGEEAG
jgi:hypothetical protein